MSDGALLVFGSLSWACGHRSRIGRPYETQNDFGSWRSADDGLAGGIANFRQHPVPWYGDPRVVD